MLLTGLGLPLHFEDVASTVAGAQAWLLLGNEGNVFLAARCRDGGVALAGSIVTAVCRTAVSGA